MCIVAAVPPRTEGRTRRHERGAGCGGRGGVAGRATLTRTAKSCGPGAPTLALSFRGSNIRESDGGKRARSPGRARISRKTIAQGRPDVSGITCGSAACYLLCTRTAGASWHPAFPAPSYDFRGSVFAATRARSAPRGRAPLSSPSPRSYGEKVGMRGSLRGLNSRREPSPEIRCANFDLSPQERGEVTSNTSCLAV